MEDKSAGKEVEKRNKKLHKKKSVSAMRTVSQKENETRRKRRRTRRRRIVQRAIVNS